MEQEARATRTSPETAGCSEAAAAVASDAPIDTSLSAGPNETSAPPEKPCNQHEESASAGDGGARRGTNSLQQTNVPKEGNPVGQVQAAARHAQSPAVAPRGPESKDLGSAASCFILNQRFRAGETVQATTAEDCQTKCLHRAGCSHFNFLAESGSCEHVFVKPMGKDVELPPLEEHRSTIAAGVSCQIPREFLADRSLKGLEGAAIQVRTATNTGGLAGGLRHAGKGTSAMGNAESGVPAVAQRAEQCSDKYVLSDTYKGNDFWAPEKFFFFEWGDPTGGTVQYVSKSDAQKYNLIKTTSDGRAQMLSDTTEVVASGQGRKSVRITSQKAWSDVSKYEPHMQSSIEDLRDARSDIGSDVNNSVFMRSELQWLIWLAFLRCCPSRHCGFWI